MKTSHMYLKIKKKFKYGCYLKYKKPTFKLWDKNNCLRMEKSSNHCET